MAAMFVYLPANPVMHPQSHYARSIFELSSWVLWVCLGIFLLVAGLVSYAGWKFRARPGEADPKQVLDLVSRGVHVRFLKESLTFTGEDSPMAHLLLSVIGAVAQFERDLIRERQREGIALAKQRKVYLGRAPSLSAAQAADLRQRVLSGEGKALLAREFGISRTTVYEYLGREVSDAGSVQQSRRKRA
jgi:hypothetical protein